MNTKVFYDLNFFNFLNHFKSEKIGLYFSFCLHLIILMFAIGMPSFFESSPINIPTVIPIEIINVSDTTSIVKEPELIEEKKTKKITPQPKKFNNVENQIVKKVELKTKPKININNTEIVKISQEEKIIEQDLKKSMELKKKQTVIEEKAESLPLKKIKPKIKPKLIDIKINTSQTTDINVKSKPKNLETNIDQRKEISVKIRPKPQPSFNIASMLKDLRNDQKSIQNQQNENNQLQEEKTLQKNENNNEEAQLSISEIDLLIQQLSSCWTAPAGAVIEKGMIVKISAKIKSDRKVLDGSIRIIDTNIPQNNPFYGPITESAMRTLLNPECSPLKLPKNKYNLWKNLTINFDHSIMKGY